MTNTQWAFETQQVHAGQTPDPTTGARALPIYQTTSFVFENTDHAAARFSLADLGPIYTRLNNPTQEVVENRIAALEGGVGALLLASGQAATTFAILNVAEAGDHVVVSSSLYGGSHNLFKHSLPKLGLKVTFVDNPSDIEAWRAAVTPETKAFFGETIGNPAGDILDIEPIADLAHEVGVPLIVDNTIATPYALRPIEFGADVVVHSATKYLGGHGDLMAGVAAGSSEHMSAVRMAGLRHYGGTPGRFESHLLLRGLKTLGLRMERHCRNAARVAEFLNGHDLVKRVHWPGFAGHPGHEVAARQMRDFGGMVSLELRGGREAAARFLDSLGLFTQAVSLGDVCSLATHPASTTHQLVPEAERQRLGVTEALVRLSVGIEDARDLLADLEQALEQVTVAQPEHA